VDQQNDNKGSVYSESGVSNSRSCADLTRASGGGFDLTTRQLVDGIAARLLLLSPDAIRGFERVLERMEKGEREYGPLDITADRRDWRLESIEELLDLCVYRGLSLVGAASRVDVGLAEIAAAPAVIKRPAVDLAFDMTDLSDLEGEGG